MVATMYPGKVNSPATTLNGGISDVQTTITVADSSKLPAAPNLMVIGAGEDAETIMYPTDAVANVFSGVTREFQGAKKAWNSGTVVARNFTAYDYDTLRTNMALKADIADPTFTGTVTAPILKATTSAGVGRVPVSDAVGVLTPTVAKRSIFLSCAGGWASTTTGAPSPTIFTETAGKQNFKGIPFIYDGAAVAYQEFGVVMPPNWDLSTIVATPYFITAGTDASSHTIIFAIQAWAWSNGDTLTQTWAGEQTSTTTVASSIANKMTIGPTTSAITVGGTPAKNDFVQFRTWRAVGTNTSTPVTLLGWLVSYTTNNYSDE